MEDTFNIRKMVMAESYWSFIPSIQTHSNHYLGIIFASEGGWNPIDLDKLSHRENLQEYS